MLAAELRGPPADPALTVAAEAATRPRSGAGQQVWTHPGARASGSRWRAARPAPAFAQAAPGVAGRPGPQRVCAPRPGPCKPRGSGPGTKRVAPSPLNHSSRTNVAARGRRRWLPLAVSGLGPGHPGQRVRRALGTGRPWVVSGVALRTRLRRGRACCFAQRLLPTRSAPGARSEGGRNSAATLVCSPVL